METVERQPLKNKKILITGGSGFVGSHLIKYLKSMRADLCLYAKDVRDIKHYKKKCGIVCHLAAINKVDCEDKTDKLFDVNVNGTKAVMEYCRKNGARCVFASSAAVYKPVVYGRLLCENSCRKPKSPYGISKMLAEDACRHYAEKFGVPVTILRIFNIFGPRQSNAFFIPSIIERLRSDRAAITVKTPGAVRDFIFVTDVARAFIQSCVYCEHGFKVLNIGTGCGTSVLEAVKKISHFMNINPEIITIGSTDIKKDFYVADIKKASTINWRPEISIDKGIRLLLKK